MAADSTFLLGFQAVLYYKLDGMAEAGDPILLTNVRDVRPLLEAGEANVTTRASGGFEEMVPALFKAGLEFEMVVDPTDDAYADFKTAFLARQVVGIRFLDQLEADGGTGFQGDMAIFKFTPAEPLDGAQLVTVTLKPTRGTTHMEEYP